MQVIHEHTIGNQVPAYRRGDFFAQLSPSALQAFDALLFPSSYPAHTVIFSEEQPATGIAVVLEGEVRLSISSSDGHRLSFCIAKAGEVLGLTAAISGRPYEMTAETIYPAKIAHVARQAFLQFLAHYPEAYQAVTRDMIHNFNLACKQLRTVGLSASAPERSGPAVAWLERFRGEERRSRALPPFPHSRRDRRVHRRLA